MLGRCCSDAFADALSDKLSNDWLMYSPDNGGVYTDTAEFVDIIPECTNISAGYMHEHTTKESLNIQHLFDLMEQVVLIDWDALPTDRDPSVKETLPMPDYYGLHAAYDVGTWYRPEPKKSFKPTPDAPLTYDWYDDVDDYNAYVFEAVCDAEDGYVDELMWLVGEAVLPDDPDLIYQRVVHTKPSRDILKALRKGIDSANTLDDMDDALNRFYVALLDEQALATMCVDYAQ